MENNAYLDDPHEITAAHREAMARMYADEHMRSLILTRIQIANQNMLTSMAIGDTKKAETFAVKFKVWKSLLEDGKVCFNEWDRLQKRRVQLQQERFQDAEENE